MSYSQTGRPIRLDTPLGEDKLLLVDFDGWEGVSQQFAFHLRALSTDDSLPLEDLLNEPVVVSLRMVHDEPRFIHGVVNRATQLERSQGLTAYQLEVVPWTWFLSLITDCRIFLDKTVPQIIEEVFSDPGLPSCVSYRLQLSESYQPREYCVQYRETDLNFVSRLLEEEGIFYYFEHSSQNHTLVLSDDSSAFPSCPGEPSIPYNAGTAAAREEDVIHTLGRRFEVCSRSVTLNDFDFQNPTENLQVHRTSDRYELYDYPGYYYGRDLGERYAAIRLEEQEARRVIVDGTSNCRQFIPGHTFQLNDLSGMAPRVSYALLWVQHSASANSYRSDGPDAFIYENHFQTIPDKVKYRPPRIAQKPSVRGTQTAIVVGPAGKEIDVDNFGRVKVHFHWERQKHDSCPVRVSQVWAGKTWGSIQIPRIGQEVVVDFLEGDPDRPLVIGRVYNAEQMPPYTLPANQTISGTKSRTSETGSGENYNELVFEDKKGSEYIRIHAEREMRQHVEKDSYEFTGQDRHAIVQGSQSERVGGDYHLSVKGESRESVTGDASLTVGGSHHAKVASVFTVEGGQEIHIKGGMKVIIEAGMQLSLVGPGGFIDIGPAGVSIQGTMVLINSGGSHGSGTASQPKDPKEPKKAEA